MAFFGFKAPALEGLVNMVESKAREVLQEGEKFLSDHPLNGDTRHENDNQQEQEHEPLASEQSVLSARGHPNSNGDEEDELVTAAVRGPNHAHLEQSMVSTASEVMDGDPSPIKMTDKHAIGTENHASSVSLTYDELLERLMDQEKKAESNAAEAAKRREENQKLKSLLKKLKEKMEEDKAKQQQTPVHNSPDQDAIRQQLEAAEQRLRDVVERGDRELLQAKIDAEIEQRVRLDRQERQAELKLQQLLAKEESLRKEMMESANEKLAGVERELQMLRENHVDDGEVTRLRAIEQEFLELKGTVVSHQEGLKAELASLRTSEESLIAEIERLRQEKEKALAEIENRGRETSQMQEIQKALNSELEALKTDYSQREEALNQQHAKELEELKATLDQRAAALQEDEQKEQQLRTMFEELQLAQAAKDTEIQTLRESEGVLKQEIEQLRASTSVIPPQPDLTAEMEALKQSHKAELEQLREELEKASAPSSLITADLEAKNEEIQSMTGVILELQSRVSELETQNAGLKLEKERSEVQAVESAQSEVQRLSQLAEQLQVRVLEVEARNATAQSEKEEAVASALESVQKEMQRLTMLVAVTEEENKTLKARLEEQVSSPPSNSLEVEEVLNAQVKEQEDRIAELISEVKTLQSTSQTKDERLAMLEEVSSNNLAALETELRIRDEKILSMETLANEQVDQLKRALDQKDEKISELENVAAGNLVDLETALRAKETEIDTLVNQAETLRIKLKEQEEKVLSMEAMASANLVSMQSELQLRDEKLQAFSNEVDSFKQQLAHREESIAVLKAQQENNSQSSIEHVGILQKQLEDLHTQLQSREAELGLSKQREEFEMNALKVEMETQRKEHLAQVESLQKELAGREARLAKLQTSMDELFSEQSAQLERTHQALTAAQSRAEELERAKVELETQLEAMKGAEAGQVGDLQLQISELQAQMEASKVDATARVTELETKLDALRKEDESKINELQVREQEWSAKCTELEAEATKYRQKAEAALSSVSAQMEELAAKLEESSQREKEFHARLTEAQTEHEHFKKRAEAALAVATSQVAERTGEVEGQVREAQTKITELERALEQANRELSISNEERKKEHERASDAEKAKRQLAEEKQKAVEEIQQKILKLEREALEEQSRQKQVMHEVEKLRAEHTDMVNRGRENAEKLAQASEIEHDLRKQVEGLQIKIQDVKQRAKEAIREAVVASSRRDSGLGTASKPAPPSSMTVRARTNSLDSLESGFLNASMDSIALPTKEPVQANIATSRAAATAASSSGPVISSSTAIAEPVTTSTSSGGATLVAPRGASPDGGGAFRLLAQQMRTAVQEARRGDWTGVSRMRVSFGILAYSAVVHLLMFSMWWSCRAA